MFKWKKKQISLQVDEDKCTGCGNCVIVCKRNVFTLMTDQNRYLSVVIAQDACKGCGHCKEVCHSKAIELIKQ